MTKIFTALYLCISTSQAVAVTKSSLHALAGLSRNAGSLSCITLAVEPTFCAFPLKEGSDKVGVCLLACLLACLAFPPSEGREKLGFGACLLTCLPACFAFPPITGREKLGFGACLLACLLACLAFPPIVGREILGFGACLLADLLACLALLPREGKEKLLFDPCLACLPILWVPLCTIRNSNQ